MSPDMKVKRLYKKHSSVANILNINIIMEMLAWDNGKRMRILMGSPKDLKDNSLVCFPSFSFPRQKFALQQEDPREVGPSSDFNKNPSKIQLHP